jgi:hypothetical protein
MTFKELALSITLTVILITGIILIGSFSKSRVELPSIENVKFKTVEIDGCKYLYGKLNRDLVLIPKCGCQDTIKLSK